MNTDEYVMKQAFPQSPLHTHKTILKPYDMFPMPTSLNWVALNNVVYAYQGAQGASKMNPWKDLDSKRAAFGGHNVPRFALMKITFQISSMWGFRNSIRKQVPVYNIHKHKCTYTEVCTFLHTCMHPCMSARMHTCTHVRKLARTHTHIHTCMYMAMPYPTPDTQQDTLYFITWCKN